MNFGGNNLAIGISLMMRDGFTTQANIARNAMQNLYNQGDRLARQQAVLARNTNAAGAAIGVGLINGMSKMYQEGADFGYIMKYVSINADKTGKSFDSLSNKALEVGKRTMFSSMEIADGMKWMAQAGMDANQIKSSIDAAADLAQATMNSISGESGTADLMNRVAAAFKIPINEQNVTRIVDVLGMAANDSATDLIELGETMKYSQATAARLGMTLEETAGATMVLANSGLRGSMGGTAFENMMRELAKASAGTSKKKNNALAMLGMTTADLKDARGNLRPIAEILGKIGNSLKGMGTADKQNVVTDLLNVRAARATDLADSLTKYVGFVNALNNAGGYTRDMGNKMMDTDKGKIDIMKSNWEALRIQLGGIFSTIFTPIVKVLTKVMDVVSMMVDTPVGKWLATMAAGFIILKTASMGYRAIQLAIKILHYDIGNSAASAGSQTVSWYNRMTQAARNYNNTAAAGKGSIGGMLGFGGGARPGTVMQNSKGQWVQVMPGGMHRFLPKGSSKVGMAKFGRFMGKAAPWATMAGMGLTMAGDSMGADNETGRILSSAGNAIGFAGTGAMVGSMIAPGIGTAIGAIVGGVGSILYDVYNGLNDVNNEIDKYRPKSSANRPYFNRENWKKQALMYQKMNWKDRAMLDQDSNSSGSIIRLADGRFKQHEGRTTSTTVILQVDGVDKFNKKVDENFLKEVIDLGI